MSRKLSPKAAAFARLYQGDGVQACTAAGYQGSRASRATIASRLLRDPRVVAILDARRGLGEFVDAPEPAAGPALGPELSADPLVGMAQLAADRTAHSSARLRALELLQRQKNADRERLARTPTFEGLRASVQGQLTARQQRERETACCSRCGGDLADSPKGTR